MYDHFQKYFRDEDGAVTVDWVVLCAFLVAFAAAIAAAMETGTLGLTSDLNTFFSAQDPN